MPDDVTPQIPPVRLERKGHAPGDAYQIFRFETISIHRAGEEVRCVLLSSPEGDDRPAKYPQASLSADCLILTKSDLVPHLPFDPARAATEALAIKPGLRVFAVSALRGEGMDALAAYFVEALARLRSAGA